MSERENEKELILGNSQLISLFFVVVALCGVFFALGYMIGRNSSKPVVASSDTAVPATSSTPSGREQPAVEAPPAAQSSPVAETTPPPVETQPVQNTPAPPITEPPAAVKTAAATTPAPAAEALPEVGTMWLQVAALRHDDAAKLVRTLKEQEFPARLADSPKADIFRVLVGPYRQTAQVADAKAKLKSLGFANAFVQK